jgi:hypothetical protein
MGTLYGSPGTGDIVEAVKEYEYRIGPGIDI